MSENEKETIVEENVKLTLIDKPGEDTLVVSTDGSTADVEDDDEVEFTKNGKIRRKKKKVKRKKIYFRSDFVGDESSSEEEASKNLTTTSKTIYDQNPADLNWMMWCWYYIVVASVSTFHAAEFCGEKLADFFGITAPKYQYAINEYHRLKQEEREEEEREQREAECVRQRQLERLAHLEGGGNQLPDVKIVHKT